MKPIFKALLLFFVISAAVACSKDDEKETVTDTDSYITLFSGKKFDLSGTWKMSARQLLPDSAWLNVPDNDATMYTFAKDGKYTMKRSSYEINGSYTLKSITSEDVFLGVKLTLYTDGGAATEWKLDVDDDGVFRMDSWQFWPGTDYISHIYNKIN